MVESARPVIFVQGTTASGKSDWALRFAQKFDGVVINCDSIQVYKKLDIGSAKPSVEERSLRPHYLFDYVNPPEEMTAGQYARAFHEVLQKLPENMPAFVVGGTGFYFMAIEKGMYPVRRVPKEIKKAVELEMASEAGAQKLWEELQAQDPEYAAKIHAADHYRIGRAIEVLRFEGKTLTQVQEEFSQQETPFEHPLLKLAPFWEREALAERISLRTQKMLEAGLVQEVQELLDEGWASWAPLQSVGYREVLAFLRAEVSEQELAPLIEQNTRQLAKKQRTWFRRDKGLLWFDGAKGFPEAERQVEEFLGSLTR